jgi:carbonic anhydrase
MPISNLHLQFTKPRLLDPKIAVGNLRRKSIQNQLEIKPDHTPDQIIDLLLQGNQQFIEMRTQNINCKSICLSAVAQGKTPFVAVLNYAHLNTATENIFGQKSSELFVINLSHNLSTQIPRPQEISGIEYGVTILGIKVVVVLGDEVDPHIQPLVPLFPENDNKSHDRLQNLKLEIKHNKILISDRIRSTTKTNLLAQIARLKDSPLICRLVQTGDLRIVGGLYNSVRGTVEIVAP